MNAADPGPAPQSPRATGRPGPKDLDAEPGPPPGYDGQPRALGGVRVRVKPRDAQVFVDGYFVGTVDDFDSGRGLPLESGPQHIEIRANGYDPLQLQVRILPDETIYLRG